MDAACAIVGAGSLGTALALRLHERGLKVRAIFSRSEERARALVERVGADFSGQFPPDVRYVFLCVPDDAIPKVASELTEVCEPWQGVTVAHTSGAVSIDALAPLTRCGARVAGFHPVQTFTRASGPDVFDGICIGIEGTDVEGLFDIARAIGAYPIEIRSEDKARYHLAASLISNFLVTLAGVSEEVLATIGLDGPAARRMYMPLLRTTVENLGVSGPGSALTGPVVRGDLSTIQRHLGAMEGDLARFLPMYRAMALAACELAVSSGRLSAARGEEVRRVIS